MTDRKLLERITLDPAIMAGKPIIRGTRLTVEYILNLLARGETIAEITQEYSGVTVEDIQACLLFSTKLLPAPSVLASDVPEIPYGDVDFPLAELVAPGRYKTPKWFGPAFVFETVAPYDVTGAQGPHGYFLDLVQGAFPNECSRFTFWSFDETVSLDRAIIELRAYDQLQFTSNQTVIVFNRPAIQFDAAAGDAIVLPPIGKLVGMTSGAWRLCSRNAHLRFIFLSAADHTLLFNIESSPNDLEAFFADAQHVLETVKFVPSNQ